MNRAHRRATMANATKSDHANQSFAQLAGAANREALKPFILEEIQAATENLQRQLARQQLDALAGLQTRMVAVERVLMQKFGLTEDDLAELNLEVEDDATGYKKVDGSIERGDLIRMTLQIKPAEATEDKFSRKTKVTLFNVGQSPAPGRAYQTYPVVEEGMLGMTPNETRDFTVSDEAATPETSKSYTFRVQVQRVSRKPQKAVLAPQTEAAPSEENQNA